MFRVLRLTAVISCVVWLGISASALGQGIAGGQAGGQAGGAGGQAGGTGGAAGGILIDPQGVVLPVFARDPQGKLDAKRRSELAGKVLPADLNHFSKLRKVSLVRLEQACEEFARNKQHVTGEMQYLAGLQRIDYVFVYPEERDIVIAGPAEGYLIDSVGRAVGVSTRRPPLRLDDLIVALRAVQRGGRLGCSIDPVPSRLAELKAYVAQNSQATNAAAARQRYDRMAEILGLQDVSVFGVPAETHFGATLVEADYRMKQMTCGLERPPVPGFRSYLSMIGASGNSMQRWWFTPQYDQFTRSADGLAFQFAGQRVQLLSQEEFVEDNGRRQDANFTRVSLTKYAQEFTEKYPKLADASPVFAELQSLFDLAVLAAMLKKERLPQQVDWSMSLFLDPQRATVAKRNVPRQVNSVVNSKKTGGSLVGIITGGVTIDPLRTLSQSPYQSEGAAELTVVRVSARSADAARPAKHPWWWD